MRAGRLFLGLLIAVALPISGCGRAVDGAELGIDNASWELPCRGAGELGAAMRPQRQQQLTSLAVRAFFDSLFARDPAVREASAVFLSTGLPRELADARVGGR